MTNRKRITAAAALALALLGAAAAGSAQQKDVEAEKNIFAMDTFMTLRAIGPEAEEAVEAASKEILRLDAMLSTGNENSVVYRLNQDGEGTATEEMKELLAYSEDLYESTGGCFNIAIYPVMQLWGFPTGEYHVPDEKELAQVQGLLDMSQVQFDEESGKITLLQEGMAIDFGGIAKGYTSSRVMEMFEEYGVEAGLINLGGNVHTFRTKTDGSYWRVAIKNPWNTDAYLGVVEVADEAVITSGGYERYFEEDGQAYHHIIDPATCTPAEAGLTSVTIVSRDGTLADGLSTSLYIMGREKAEAYWREHPDEFETILVEEDGTIAVSEGLADRFTSEEEFEIMKR